MVVFGEYIGINWGNGDDFVVNKVFISVGHGGRDFGAVCGRFRESEINLVMALACKEKLEKAGVKVLMSRVKDEYDPIGDEIRECNTFRPDLAVDIHNNAGGGDGFEVYYYSGGGVSKILAKNIEDEVKGIGQNSRGCKVRLDGRGRDYFGFVRDVYAPSVIVEGVFLDNERDMRIADSALKQRKFG